MAFEQKEMTALIPSVGADERQSNPKNHTNSIPPQDAEINDYFDGGEENIDDVLRRIERIIFRSRR